MKFSTTQEQKEGVQGHAMEMLVEGTFTAFSNGDIEGFGSMAQSNRHERLLMAGCRRSDPDFRATAIRSGNYRTIDLRPVTFR